MTGLHIADDLALPAEYGTATAAILAIRGAGKTYTGNVLAEELLDAGQQIVVLDPTGAWWGLRSNAAGDGPGKTITILGGDHGDIPLEATGGALVADVVAANPGSSFILDLSAFESNAAQDRFATAFLERLYRAKNGQRSPLHLMVDEADSFAPQRPAPNQARMLGAMEALVRRGRIRGIGCTLITQRAAVLNKNVLTQAEILICLKVTGPQDKKALDEWVRGNGDDEHAATMKASLAGLGKGQAWVWAPALDVFEQIQVRRRTTFDSSATPKPGELQVQPTGLATVDIDALRTAMADTIERQEADDPKRLHRRIADLERQLAKAEAAKPEPVIERVEVPVLDQDLADELAETVFRAADLARQIAEALTRFRDVPTAPAPRPRPAAAPASRRSSPPPTPTGDAPVLKAGARRMLDQLAGHHPLRISKAQVATLAGMKKTGGTFGTYWSQLKRAGYLTEDGDGLCTITDAGLAAAGVEPGDIATTEELVETWRKALKAGARNMLDVLIDRYPASITKTELAEQIGMEVTGGTFGTYLSTLRRNLLADVDGQDVTANPTLFPEDR